MENLITVRLADRPELFYTAAKWFSSKWGVPVEAYLESMRESVKTKNGVPEWYVVLDGDIIAGGVGVIENDFHRRHDLTPNICAVYVEKPYRMRGLARHLLDTACERLAQLGTETAYLITSHTELYEHMGWSFYCMVEEDDGDQIRMYRKVTEKK